MIVLDASGLLCFLHDETGNDIVANALPDTAVSAVNWSEVIQKPWKKELPPMRGSFCNKPGNLACHW